jgi:hypothetical protein
VPVGHNLEGTLLEFCRRFNVIEFKGANDSFDEAEFVKNEVRVALVFLENTEATFENLLNVIVTSRWPGRFFGYMSERGYEFTAEPGQEWLRRCRVGLQDVVVVICNQLPVEAKFADWIVFAPTDSAKWRKAVLMLARQRNWQLLELAQDLGQREFAAMTPELDKIFTEYAGMDQEQFIKDQQEAAKLRLLQLSKLGPHALAGVLADLKPEERLAGLKPEERLADLKPEERLAGLKPEERLADLKPEERLAGLKPEEREILRKILLEDLTKPEDNQ